MQLDLIGQYTTNIRHVSGEENAVADFFSRIDEIHSDVIDYDLMAKQQSSCAELERCLNDSSMSLNLKKIHTDAAKAIYCDISTKTARPFVPVAMRVQVLTKMHNISHPGTRATTKLVCERFVWPNMKKDIRLFVEQCAQCQKCKVHRHTKTVVEQIPVVARFKHVHIDIVGPLPSSRGYNYVLTMIDRFTRWPEAVPMVDSTAPQVASAFVASWVSRFGVPEKVTTDLGRQFESGLFNELMVLLGVDHLRTTPYHPSSNGIIERWHRGLKASIMCRANVSWSDELPMILLAHRNIVKEDIGVCPSQLVYGTALTLPGELVQPCEQFEGQSDFVKDLQSAMNEIRPTSVVHHDNRDAYIPKDLATSSHVWARVDKVKPALCAPYTGPHRVIERQNKYYIIDVNNKRYKISVDRIKPATLCSRVDKKIGQPSIPAASSLMTTKQQKMGTADVRQQPKSNFEEHCNKYNNKKWTCSTTASAVQFLSKKKKYIQIFRI